MKYLNSLLQVFLFKSCSFLFSRYSVLKMTGNIQALNLFKVLVLNTCKVLVLENNTQSGSNLNSLLNFSFLLVLYFRQNPGFEHFESTCLLENNTRSGGNLTVSLD